MAKGQRLKPEQISNHGDLQQPPTVTEVFDACQLLISKSS